MIARTTGGSSSTSATAASETNRSRWIPGMGFVAGASDPTPFGLLMMRSSLSDPFHLDRETRSAPGAKPGTIGAEAPPSWRLACGDGHLEEEVRRAALGVHDPLGHPPAVEMLHLLHHVGVLQRRRTVRVNSHRTLVASN